MNNTHFVICDCDNTMGLPGKPIDDGQTLVYLFGRPDIELLGVTTTFGNGSIDEVHAATAELLRQAGRTGIPLLKGEGERRQPPTAAAHFLADQAASRPGEITLLAIGPLGNLRAAAELDPHFFANLKQVVTMGGYLHPLPLPGWEEIPELNFSCDPEGAYALLRAACPVTIMNAHICLQAPFGPQELAPIAELDPIFHEIQQRYLLDFMRTYPRAVEYLWDLLPAVFISYPDLFDHNPTSISSTLTDLESGTLVVDLKAAGPVVNMPSSILDRSRFYEILYQAWGNVKLQP